MHIPDGYLSLQTSIPVLGAMIPLWSAAIAKVKKTLSHRQLPLLSLCAAFSFVIMMFNIPLGPSSVHAVGAVFIAVLMGPWAACIAVSTALAIQALIFGDGGILALGANCFNIAFAMSFVGYYTYKVIAGGSAISSRRSMAGIFAGSYLGLNIAALLTAVEFGIQPLLFKTAEGIPEFGFYPLSVSIPAMMSEHLLIAGPVEGIVTVSAIAYLAKFAPHLLEKAAGHGTAETEKKSVWVRYRAFFIGLSILILATPLGLFATGTAWGEWGLEEIRAMIGFVPKGLERLSQTWNSLIPDYAIPGLEGGFFGSSVGYVASAVLGIVLIAVVLTISGKWMVKRDEQSK